MMRVYKINDKKINEINKKRYEKFGICNLVIKQDKSAEQKAFIKTK